MESTQTPFNMAVATLQRLDTLLKLSSEAAINGDLLKWQNVLLDLRRSVAPFCKPSEIESIEKIWGSLPNHWKTFSNSRGTVTNPVLYSKVETVLDKVSLELQMLIGTKGLLMPKSEDPRLALQG